MRFHIPDGIFHHRLVFVVNGRCGMALGRLRIFPCQYKQQLHDLHAQEFLIIDISVFVFHQHRVHQRVHALSRFRPKRKLGMDVIGILEEQPGKRKIQRRFMHLLIGAVLLRRKKMVERKFAADDLGIFQPHHLMLDLRRNDEDIAAGHQMLLPLHPMLTAASGDIPNLHIIVGMGQIAGGILRCDLIDLTESALGEHRALFK